jgi:hypothetical protein
MDQFIGKTGESAVENGTDFGLESGTMIPGVVSVPSWRSWPFMAIGRRRR